MSADRSEKLTVTRANSGTIVKLVVAEDGVTVSYSVKSYESAVRESIKLARAGADRILAQTK